MAWLIILQVSGLKTLLETDANSENDLGLDKVPLGNTGLSWPPPDNAYEISSCIGLDVLWQIYVKRVDPIMKLLHIPTTQTLIALALSAEYKSNPGTNCLFAAIKFAAITSLTDTECWSMGCSRDSLLRVFRNEVQKALNDANFLTSHNFITLKAFVIFLVSDQHSKNLANLTCPGLQSSPRATAFDVDSQWECHQTGRVSWSTSRWYFYEAFGFQHRNPATALVAYPYA